MFELIQQVVKTAATHEVLVDPNASPQALRIDARDLVNICKAIYQHPQLYFDMLSCMTGVDNGVQANTMDVVYNLYSIPFNHHLMLKVTVARDNSTVDSVCEIWRTADWHEREIFDMYGLTFNNHPDLRRILMPADWEGYPLRKDYKQQEYYRNIKLDY